MVKITIGENEAGQRLDRFLRKYLKRESLSGIYRIIRQDLKVNGKRAREDRRLAEGDELVLYMSEEQLQELVRPVRNRTARRQFQIIYEDEQVLIVSKPKGLLTHGDAREKSNTLSNQVCGYLQEQGEYDPSAEMTFTPSPVNRLDRNTSGLVMFGKTAESLRLLTRLIRERDRIRKFYLAIVVGEVKEEMVLTGSLTKDRQRNRVSVEETEDARASETRVRPIAAGRKFSLVEAELITGRTHQIRAHMAHAGHPLLGDPKYGDPKLNAIAVKQNLRGQLLHAYRLEFGEMPPVFRNLSNRAVQAPPPKAFERAGKELIDVEISL